MPAKRSGKKGTPAGLEWLFLLILIVAIVVILQQASRHKPSTQEVAEEAPQEETAAPNTPRERPARSKTARATPRSDSKPAGFAATNYKYLGGYPVARSAEAQFHVLENPGFAVGFNEKRKAAGWVYYRLFFVPDPANLTPPGDFQRDERTYAKTTSDDFSKTGFDRGHLAPNDAISDCYGPEAQRATFLMSNVIAQRPAFNRGIWKHLEALITKHYTRRAAETWVVTGPVFSAQPETLKSGVAIPERCYKIVVDQRQGGYEAIAFALPQSASSHDELGKYLVSIRQIETDTNLDFFPQLDRTIQDTFESVRAATLWPKPEKN